MFLYLFDMIDFDSNGAIKSTKNVDLEHSRSNYLYLISKYNQKLLEIENIKIPDFFKKELKDVLFDVENHGNFERAKKLVLANCLPEVQFLAEKSVSDRDFVENLNAKIAVFDLEFASKVKAQNSKHLEYILAKDSGAIFNKIVGLQLQDLSDKATKSNLFKEIIKYNALIETADKIRTCTTSPIMTNVFVGEKSRQMA